MRKTRDWRRDPPTPKIEVCPFGPNRGPRWENCSVGSVTHQRLYQTFERCRPSPTRNVIPSRTTGSRLPGKSLLLFNAMLSLTGSSALFFNDVEYDPFKR